MLKIPALLSILLISLVLVSTGLAAGDSPAGDWPMSAGNADRSGYVNAVLPKVMVPLWVHEARVKPKPAWPRLDKMPFDRVYHPVAADSSVFFASNGDGGVYALDAQTGEQSWSFFTEAPVRFAPAIWRDRMFVGSDDGHLYCLRLTDGQLLWKKRGGPSDQMVMGNERMISRWPVRGGPVVRDNVVYFAAGIFPTDGVFLYALDVATGEEVWVNRESGNIDMAQPHGGAFAESGVCAQGYLVATQDKLVVPTGRGVPAVFDRATGKFEYYHLQKGGWRGGATTMIAGSICYNNGHVIDLATGDVMANIGAGSLARTEDGLVHATSKGVVFCKWTDSTTPDDKAKAKRKMSVHKHIENIKLSSSVIVVGSTVVVGGEGKVAAVDFQSGEPLWHFDIDGEAYALAAADGKLLVSTDAGKIYCFGDGSIRAAARELARNQEPINVIVDTASGHAAEAILKQTGIQEGYAIDLGAGEGDLAIALARRSKLHIIAVEPDEQKAQIARQRAIDAGLYGDRIVVHNKAIDATPYPKHFANLVVSGQTVTTGGQMVNHTEAKRLQRPYGGVVALAAGDQLDVDTRGALEGTGQWTHQYANPANTSSTNDDVNGPLAPHWFRDVDQSIVQRHGRGPSPLYREGRLFSLGIDTLVCVDSYNGRLLWEHELPAILRAYHGDELMGVSGTGSPYCVGKHGIYVRRDGYAMRIDPITGKEIGRFNAPRAVAGEESKWGFIATVGNLLFGSVADTDHIVTYRFRASSGDMTEQLTESKLFFVMDAKTGELIWRYKPKHSIRHNAISIGGGLVHLIDRPQAEFDRSRKTDGDQPLGTLIALDAKTGQVKWENSEDIWGTVLIHGVEQNALLMSYQPTRFQLASEKGGKLSVFDSSTGKRLWQQDNVKYRSRPLLIARTIYTQGGAWDLMDGSMKDFKLGDRSYGCGVLSAGRNLIAYRSATLGYCDLTDGDTTRNFGGLRVGCWINSLPAGGLLLIPDGSSGCRCAYQNQTWIALQTDTRSVPPSSP